MRVLSRLDRIAKLVFLTIPCCTAFTTYAQPLEQPNSLRPWKSANAEVPRIVMVPTQGSSNNSPAWLLDSPTGSETAAQEAQLPNVETEHASDLGTLENHAKPPRSYSTRSHNSYHSDSSQPFNLFRTLGFRASSSANRR